MKKLRIYLIIGIILSSMLSSCNEPDCIDPDPHSLDVESCSLTNLLDDSVKVIWYSQDGVTDTMNFAANSESQVKPYFALKLGYKFDSISISCNSQKITFVPLLIDNVEYPRAFAFILDKSKSSVSEYYWSCTIKGTSLMDIAEEMATFGQNVWRRE